MPRPTPLYSHGTQAVRTVFSEVKFLSYDASPPEHRYPCMDDPPFGIRALPRVTPPASFASLGSLGSEVLEQRGRAFL